MPVIVEAELGVKSMTGDRLPGEKRILKVDGESRNG